MSTQDPSVLEGTGEGFSLNTFLEARVKAQEAVNMIVARVQVGMLEEDANKMVVTTLQEMGSNQAFHKPYIRFGTNTVKTFGADSDPGIRLGEDDIFFIDVGPVWDGYEGDAGDTFLTGNNPEMKRCALDARAIFQAVAEKWEKEKSTGIELYQFAAKRAKYLGWELNLDLGGHRLGDYPSAEHYEGPLSEISFHPSPNRWMVEIHIRHPGHLFGAFYEDLLSEPDSSAVREPEKEQQIAIQQVPMDGVCGGY
ncbi:MAG: M24 family metallopeptidase [Desulfuromonadales bacterium]